MAVKSRYCADCKGYTRIPAERCEHCGSIRNFSEFQPTNSNLLSRVFPSGFFRDIDYDPVYIRGRKELLSETRRRGQVSFYAED